MLIDLSNKSVTGKVAAVALEKAGIVLNYNTVPGETRKASDPSGIRLGTPSVTSRGFGIAEMKKIAFWMNEAINNVNDDAVLSKIGSEVAELCNGFPVPGIE
jgi:glycine hydroxymethyltransferase